MASEQFIMDSLNNMTNHLTALQQQSNENKAAVIQLIQSYKADINKIQGQVNQVKSQVGNVTQATKNDLTTLAQQQSGFIESLNLSGSNKNLYLIGGGILIIGIIIYYIAKRRS